MVIEHHSAVYTDAETLHSITDKNYKGKGKEIEQDVDSDDEIKAIEREITEAEARVKVAFGIFTNQTVQEEKYEEMICFMSFVTNTIISKFTVSKWYAININSWYY
jgi:hypothetical protein